MKKLSVISVLVILLLPLNANATKYKFIASDNSIETKVCVLAGSNNKSGLIKALRQSANNSVVINKRSFANNVNCNDMVMAHFAHKYEALDTFGYLNILTNGKNRITPTSVEIKDIAAISNRKNEKIKVIYVSSTK